jgi:hypothetical protein
MRAPVLVLLVACSPSERGDDQQTTDARTSSSDGGTQLTETNVNCTDYVRTRTAPGGSKVVTTFRRAFVDVGPQDEFLVVSCGAPDVELDPCPANHTCTGSAGPAAQQCVSNRSGTFVGGKLMIECGRKTQEYDAAGTVTYTHEYQLASVKLFK